ncbi:MAG: 16S rRNA (cytidine(1402)-2'-O)-methyltransferase [Proteobacteria bacterium]|nr:16S rRNA (cytidine(1402)-2'-O)-methyltransferase [Pseudomonadota bacterium]
MDVELKPGLYIVPTPIGNLKDITLRAIDYLKSCDVIYCEDTRVTGQLLQNYSIKKPLFTYHEHNAPKAREQILEKITKGQSICLVSDAGMPLISDPGYKLIRELHVRGLFFTSLPGPCAAISALCLSGMPTNQFFFAGFYESKMAKNIKTVPATLIFYESARRIIKTLESMAEIFNNRLVVVVREISKIYEESIFGTFSEVCESLTVRDAIRGEIVIVLSPPKEEEIAVDAISAQIAELLKTNSLKDVASMISEIHGITKKQAYNLALAQKNKQPLA